MFQLDDYILSTDILEQHWASFFSKETSHWGQLQKVDIKLPNQHPRNEDRSVTATDASRESCEMVYLVSEYHTFIALKLSRWRPAPRTSNPHGYAELEHVQWR
jgi:hypothetical protein